MLVAICLVILNFVGNLSARHPDIDLNRLKLVPKERFYGASNLHNRRSIINNQRRNDYDHHSSRFTELRSPTGILYGPPPATEAKGKVYQPREDPRFFYQSDAYAKEINRQNLNNEVSSVYLGRGVVRANEIYPRSLPIRVKDYSPNSIDEDACIRCPYDRTLIAKASTDRALLLKPRIITCSGRRAPRDVRFIHMYGPKFGSLLAKGSHMLVGQIKRRDEILQTCKMQIHVLIQSCPVPKYLVAQCGAENKTCDFTCKDPKAELYGYKRLTCEDDMRWSGRLPACSARRWCPMPPPPDHGEVSCKGATAANGWALNEGASCRLKCDAGWRWSSRAPAICRRGVWTHALKCQPKRNR